MKGGLGSSFDPFTFKMRKLNKKQKEILKNWFDKNKKNIGYSFDCEFELHYPIYEKVKDLNNFENFNQEVNRFIRDLVEDK